MCDVMHLISKVEYDLIYCLQNSKCLSVSNKWKLSETGYFLSLLSNFIQQLWKSFAFHIYVHNCVGCGGVWVGVGVLGVGVCMYVCVFVETKGIG